MGVHVGNFHPERQQPGRHGVAQEVRIDALGDPSGAGDLADDLTDPLPGQDVWHRPRALLSAGEQWADAATVDVQLQKLGEGVVRLAGVTLSWQAAGHDEDA